MASHHPEAAFVRLTDRLQLAVYTGVVLREPVGGSAADRADDQVIGIRLHSRPDGASERTHWLRTAHNQLIQLQLADNSVEISEGQEITLVCGHNHEGTDKYLISLVNHHQRRKYLMVAQARLLNQFGSYPPLWLYGGLFTLIFLYLLLLNVSLVVASGVLLVGLSYRLLTRFHLMLSIRPQLEALTHRYAGVGYR